MGPRQRVIARLAVVGLVAALGGCGAANTVAGDVNGDGVVMRTECVNSGRIIDSGQCVAHPSCTTYTDNGKLSPTGNGDDCDPHPQQPAYGQADATPELPTPDDTPGVVRNETGCAGYTKTQDVNGGCVDPAVAGCKSIPGNYHIDNRSGCVDGRKVTCNGAKAEYFDDTNGCVGADDMPPIVPKDYGG